MRIGNLAIAITVLSISIDWTTASFTQSQTADQNLTQFTLLHELEQRILGAKSSNEWSKPYLTFFLPLRLWRNTPALDGMQLLNSIFDKVETNVILIHGLSDEMDIDTMRVLTVLMNRDYYVERFHDTFTQLTIPGKTLLHKKTKISCILIKCSLLYWDWKLTDTEDQWPTIRRLISMLDAISFVADRSNKIGLRQWMAQGKSLLASSTIFPLQDPNILFPSYQFAEAREHSISAMQTSSETDTNYAVYPLILTGLTFITVLLMFGICVAARPISCITTIYSVTLFDLLLFVSYVVLDRENDMRFPNAPHKKPFISR